PPRLTTIGKLPELLYRPELPLADPVLARRVWALALAGLDREVVTQLFPHPPDADDLRGWATLARLVERYHRELGGAGLRFRDLADRCRAGLIHDDPARWDALDLAATGYLARLDALGFSDRESARRAALEARALEAGADLWLVGVVEIPGIVRQMLRELRGKV